MELQGLTPAPPGWTIDWPGIEAAFPFLEELADCPQDPEYHAEGDVWTHTRMVCRALIRLDSWRELEPESRAVLFWAALLHDLAKPAVSKIEGNRIISPGHAPRGGIMARRILFENAVPFQFREAVCALIRLHTVPFYLIDRPAPLGPAYQVATVSKARDLALLARADSMGRVCDDQDELLLKVDLFEEYCREQNCYEGPPEFPSAHSRFLFYRSDGTRPPFEAYDDTRSDVTLMSGLPGAGKDYWLKGNYDHPIISLDDFREEMGIKPTANQGQVISKAREMAREYLRAGRPFAWNATNISRRIRASCLDLFSSY